MIQIDLPWPSKDLSPNARVHWAEKHRTAKKHREDAHWRTKPHGPIEADKAIVTITAYPPTRAAFDDDNFIARCKAYLDGIADGLEVNDRAFRIQPLRRGEPIKGGNVRFEIEVPQ
ncbi:MAG: hypothetical protein KF810_16950 [Rhizobiaceae bacterium]|nr:hypothetical protein [Rhizobiaceae bacterium]